MATPRAAAEHYRQQQLLKTATVAAARRIWRKLGTGDFDEAWRALGPQLLILVTAAQVRAAADAAAYVPRVIAEQGLAPDPVARIAPAAFGAGFASDGRPLGSLLYQPVTDVRASMAGGSTLEQALGIGERALTMIVATQVADTGRLAESVGTTADYAVNGWVRMLVPPSCNRCVNLAGKHFKWNSGFRRHPHCDCRHIPSTEALSGDVSTDPYAYFRSLDEAAQNAAFGAADAQAIRDGADLHQVVNASRNGRTGMTTAEGVRSRRGYAAMNFYGGPMPRGSVPNYTRLTPEGIYARAETREDALRLLRDHGYIVGRIGAAT